MDAAAEELLPHPACIRNGERKIVGRVCVCKRTPTDTLKEQEALRKQGIKKCHFPSENSMEYAGYIMPNRSLWLETRLLFALFKKAVIPELLTMRHPLIIGWNLSHCFRNDLGSTLIYPHA